MIASLINECRGGGCQRSERSFEVLVLTLLGFGACAREGETTGRERERGRKGV